MSKVVHISETQVGALLRQLSEELRTNVVPRLQAEAETLAKSLSGLLKAQDARVALAKKPEPQETTLTDKEDGIE